jgi:hypothetical protein
LTIDAPTGETGGWSLAFLETPATNTILHDSSHDSELVVGLLPGGRAEQPLPTCDSLMSQPCRPNLGSVPPGKLDVHSMKRERPESQPSDRVGGSRR